MKTKLYLTIGLISIIGIVGINRIINISDSYKSELIKANFEALSQGEDDKSYPKYINDTEIRSDHEFKLEYNPATGGNIEYKRSCTTVIVTCKHTSKDDDICYGDLNGLATTCGVWNVVKM